MNMKPRTNIRRMNMIQQSVFSIASLLLALCATAQETVSQKDIDLVRYMPDRPFPYKMKGWKAIARQQDRLLFAFDAQAIGRAHVGTPVTHAPLLCRLLLAKTQ